MMDGDAKCRDSSFVCTLFCFLFFSAGQVFSQADIRFERIGVDDGLSQSAITSMVQDKYGYLWIGTLDGLNRYDGKTFTVYKNVADKQQTWRTNSISKLILDEQERLWVTYRNGLSLYDPVRDNFSQYNLKVGDRNLFIRDLDILSDSLVLLCTNQGLFDFNPLTRSIKPSEAFLQTGALDAREFILTRQNHAWLFTNRELWKRTNGKWSRIFKSDEDFVASYIDETDEIYMRITRALLKFDPASNTMRLISDFPPAQLANAPCIFKTEKGDLWVGHGNVYIFDKYDSLINTLSYIPQDPNSLSGPFVSEIYQTKDGVIWVGTNGLGLNKFNPFRSVFSYLGTYPGAPLTLADNFVTAIYTNDDITILAGTLDGLNVIDLANRRSRHYRVTGKNGTRAQVFKIFQDASGKKWLATNRGLMSFADGVISPSKISYLSDPGLAIHDALMVGRTSYVLATSKGLLLWEQRDDTVNEIVDLGSIVLKEMGQKYWIESGDRIHLVAPGSNQIIKTFPPSGANAGVAPFASVKCFFQDSDNNIWIGTDGGGLALYDSTGQTFRHFREADGLPNNVVYGILEDQQGNLWLSTNKGISVFDRKTKKSIRNFGKTDGLQGNEFNTRAYFQSPSGKMYFGGVNGLSFFDPSSALKIPSFTPKTIVTGFYINNIRTDHLEDGRAISELLNGEELRLDWNQRNFSFDVAGLGFTFPSGIRYQYKLENFDTDWSFLGNQNRIAFTNLPIGRYILCVKSGNSFGDWEEEGLSIRIRILAPIWRSPWFVYSGVAFLLIAVYFFSYQRTRLLRKRAAHLQRLVDERTREIQRQQEEIAAQNEELTAQAETLGQHNYELEKIKETLEKRVENRTETLRRLNDELIDQNVQLEQFTFITAHNIRGPVARIKGLINLLPKETESEVASHLKTSIVHLDQVITDLNTVLNITHGINKSFEPVSVREQLLLTLGTLRQDIESLQAEVDISGFEDLSITGVKPYFQSIFYNLIHNALKYADESRGAVIRCYTVSDPGATRIVVEDNGIGIDMRYAKEKIFKLYQRFHPNIQGKGYGLFLVKTQVKAMGGTIDVESEPGKGTRFIIDFPRTAA